MIGLTWLTFASQVSNNLLQISIAIGFTGFAIFGALGPALEMAVEFTYPVPEGTSSSLMWAGGQFCGLAFIGLMQGPLKDETGRMVNGMWMLVAVTLVSFCFALLLTPDYRRVRIEEERKTQRLLQGLGYNDAEEGANNSDELNV